ncbi:MAG: alpha-1,4-glucan--maltose-1-phosphate maltosyltransferase [Acidimicrobiia bacterium]
MSKLRATAERVVIESVTPSVDGGRFPSKAALGDPVTVEANVFADGHDSIACVLRYRRSSGRGWTETPMRFLGNDRWRAEFTPSELGVWHFEIVGWVDRFDTWVAGLAKKVEAGVDVSVDLVIGAGLIEEASGRAEAKAAKTLVSLAKEVGDETAPITARVETAMAAETVEMVRRFRDRSRATTSETRWPVVVDREIATYSTWYEMFPRSWAREPGEPGTFADVEARLGYVASMGFDVLYLPPIHPIGTTFRKGRNNTVSADPDDPGVPWAIGSKEGGHTAIEPALGTIEDFRSLRDAAGEHGLELALDIAFQCSPDHPWVTEHPDWFRHRPDGSVQYAENPPKKYQDIYPLDFETEDANGLWLALKGVFDHWISEGIRIFRVDNPHTKSFPFWEWVIPAVREEHPDVVMLAEAFTRPAVMYRLAKAGFNQSYTYFAWRTSREELTAYTRDLAAVSHFFRPSFWPNTPDILTEELQTGGRAAFISRYVLAATLSPACGIYGPAYELMESKPLYEGSEEYHESEKYQIRVWDLDRPETLAPLLTQVNKAKKAHPALQRFGPPVFHETDNETLICFSKHAGEDVALVIVSLDHHHMQSGWVNLDLAALGVRPGEKIMLHDLLTERRYQWDGSHNFIQLDPAGIPAHVFALRGHSRKEEGFDYF